jgi:dTDP-4-amino-4,6-dideoxygalactose transaminase
MHSKTGYALTNMLFSKQYFESRNKQILEYPEHEFKAYNSVKHILKDKLPGYIERSKMQNANGEYLSEKLGKHFHILRSKGNFVNYFAFPVLIGNRDEAYEFMKGKGIMCGKHFQHALPWALHHGYQKDTCPTFEKYEGQILTIPSNYSLKKKELDLIVRYLNEVAQKTT